VRLFTARLHSTADGYRVERRARGRALVCWTCRTALAETWRSSVDGSWLWCTRSPEPLERATSRKLALIAAAARVRHEGCPGCVLDLRWQEA
jgi:hypothetical protein